MDTLNRVNIDACESLYVAVTSGNLLPNVILRGFGGKPIQAANPDGCNSRAAREYTFSERAEN